MHRIADRRFERLIMRRGRTVVESGRHPNPTESVGVQDERLVPWEGIVATGAGSRLVIRRLRGDKIGHIETRPVTGFRVPPNQLFSLAPWFTVRAGGSAIIQNAAVGRPGESPPVTVEIFRVALVRAVFPRLRENAGINPAPTGGRAIRFQRGETRNKLSIGYGVAIDFLKNRLCDRLLVPAFSGIVPCQSVQPRVARARVFTAPLFQQTAEVKNETIFAAAIARGIDGLFAPLQQALRIGERSIFLGVAGGRHEGGLGLYILRTRFSTKHFG